MKEIANKAKKNDFISISELMTGIENKVFSRKEVSQLIFKESHDSLKIGITGPPGAGKSSLMNKLIPLIRKQNLSVGVIAVDPSSPITGGSFLGDRVRINNAVNDNDVFVRSMGSRAELGGVTDLAEDFSDILAFSGKDIIFIETVGVGQSEYSVSEITDLTTLVFVPESGDEIQLLAGDRVSAEGHITCGYCRNCRAGKRHLCHRTVGIGIQRNGAFAEYLVIPESNV